MMRQLIRRQKYFIPVLISKEDVILEPVMLINGEYISPSKLELPQGNTLRFWLIPDLNDEFTGLRRASQLTLASASVVLEYKQIADSNTDIGNNDLAAGFGVARTWRGEVDAEADITGTQLGVWWVRSIDAIRWRSAGSSLSSVSTLSNAFQTNSQWRSQNSVAALTTYFATTTYNSNRFYYYYDNALGEVRRFSRTETWTTLTSGNEYNDVAFSEVSFVSSDLATRLYLDISLDDNSILEDKINEFRCKIVLNS